MSRKSSFSKTKIIAPPPAATQPEEKTKDKVDAWTQYEATQRRRSVDERLDIIVPPPTTTTTTTQRTRGKKAALSLNAALTSIPKIYDFCVEQSRRAWTLHDGARHCLNRECGIRAIAKKHENQLLEACASIHHPRLRVFAQLWNDIQQGSSVKVYNDAVFQLFAQFLGALRRELTVSLSHCMFKQKSQAPKYAIAMAVDKTFTATQRLDPDSYRSLLKAIADAWSPTTSSSQGGRRTSDASVTSVDDTISEVTEESSEVIETVNVDTALSILLPGLKKEIRLRRMETASSDAASAIQKVWRQTKDHSHYIAAQCQLWEAHYERIDAAIHKDEGSRSNCFTFDEFRRALTEFGIQKKKLPEEFVFILFDAWHAHCDELLLEEAEASKGYLDRYGRGIAAIAIQRTWRMVRNLRKVNLQHKREIDRDVSALKKVVMNKREIHIAACRARRVHLVERLFLFNVRSVKPNEYDLAMELEAARGRKIAQEAFAAVMIRYGFDAPPLPH